MKKCVFYLVVFGLVTSCNVDEVNSDLFSQPQAAENTTDCVGDNPPSVLGKTYIRSGFVIDVPVDVDGDGVFSTDLMEEQLCYDLVMQFRDDFKVSNPTFDAVSLYVDDDGNGNLSQRMVCSHADGLGNTYKQCGETLEFYYNIDELQFTGTLSQDETTITFEFPNELLFGFNFFDGGNDILLEDGTVFQYEGGAIVTYTLQ
jgi:hypothetical protein